MSNFPTDVAQQALDCIGSETVISDLEQGTREAQVLLRAYWICLRQLLRAAPWDCARREVPLVLLADATGQTPNVGTMVPAGFRFAYEYPIDCARVRYVPQRYGDNPGAPAGNYAIPTTPLTTGTGTQPFVGRTIRPSRFLITNDPNYPPPPGQQYWEVQGVSPQGRMIICSNVACAHVVYTMIVNYPSVWDALFRGAMVSYLASEVALALTRDKKFGLQLRTNQIEVTKQKVTQARIADGNEGWGISDIRVDWLDARIVGGGVGGRGFGGWGGDGAGTFGGGWDSLSLADGVAF